MSEHLRLSNYTITFHVLIYKTLKLSKKFEKKKTKIQTTSAEKITTKKTKRAICFCFPRRSFEVSWFEKDKSE